MMQGRMDQSSTARHQNWQLEMGRKKYHSILVSLATTYEDEGQDLGEIDCSRTSACCESNNSLCFVQILEDLSMFFSTD